MFILHGVTVCVHVHLNQNSCSGLYTCPNKNLQHCSAVVVGLKQVVDIYPSSRDFIYHSVTISGKHLCIEHFIIKAVLSSTYFLNGPLQVCVLMCQYVVHSGTLYPLALSWHHSHHFAWFSFRDHTFQPFKWSGHGSLLRMPIGVTFTAGCFCIQNTLSVVKAELQCMHQ